MMAQCDGAAIVTGAFSNLIAIVTALISSIGAIILFMGIL